MVKRYGADTAVQAATRADQLLAEGDADGRATWKRIMMAIERMQAEKPLQGEHVH